MKVKGSTDVAALFTKESRNSFFDRVFILLICESRCPTTCVAMSPLTCVTILVFFIHLIM